MKISNKLLLLAIASVVSTSVMPYSMDSMKDMRVPDNATTAEIYDAAAREANHISPKIAKIETHINALEDRDAKLSDQKTKDNVKKVNKTKSLIKSHKNALKVKLSHLKTTRTKLDNLAKTASKAINHHYSQMETDHNKVMNTKRDLDEDKANQERVS